jgi:hypothetical protein
MRRSSPHSNLWQTFGISTIVTTSMILATASIVQAQATEAEMQAFPMPPQAYSAQPAFGEITFLPDVGSLAIGESNTATDYKYARYTNIANRKLTIVVNSAGNFPIPMIPGTDRLRCSDIHLSYGVWVKFRQLSAQFSPKISAKIPPTGTPPLWVFYGGGGLTLSNYFDGCRINFSPTVTDRYYWGKNALTLDFRGPSQSPGIPLTLDFRGPSQSSWIPEELVVGTLEITNGFGSERCFTMWDRVRFRQVQQWNCNEPVNLRVSDDTLYSPPP